MKPKALIKKLVFKKETISDLNSSQIKNVYGYGIQPLPRDTEVSPYCTYTCPGETLCYYETCVICSSPCQEP